MKIRDVILTDEELAASRDFDEFLSRGLGITAAVGAARYLHPGVEDEVFWRWLGGEYDD